MTGRILIYLWRAAATLTVSVALLSGETHVIDLVNRPSRGYSGGYGGKGGGIYDCPACQPPTAEALPFSVELRSVEPDGKDRFIGEIILRNTGKESYSLPVGRDLSFLPARKRDKRTLLFTLKIPGAPLPERVCGSMSSNAEDASSQLALAPGDSVRVRFPVTRPELETLRTGEGASDIKVQAGIVLWKFEDRAGDVMLQGEPQRIVSGNTITVTVGPPQ